MAAIRVLQINHRKAPIPRQFRPRFELDDLREEDAVSRYRLDVESIRYLHDLIEEDLRKSDRGGKSIPPMTQLLIALRVLAKGDFYSEAGDLHGVSRSSVSRIVHRVVISINRPLDNIKFPVGDELQQVKLGFYRSCKVPNVVGAVDGTLVPIMAPVDAEEVYVCRKGYHALNIQAVVDSSLRFLDVVARWPGSTHDASIFEHCGLKDHLERTNVGHLLGDSGYPLKTTLLTPFLHPGNMGEVLFNEVHIKGRACVERAFGVTKSRFRCLHKSGGCLLFTPDKCAQIVICCTRLHNLCLTRGLPAPDPVDLDQDNVLCVQGQDEPQGRGAAKREAIVRLFV